MEAQTNQRAAAAKIANPHYATLGGEPAVRRLTNRFYELMDALPQAQGIRAMHPADLGDAREHLFMFLTGWLGGPPLYAQHRGPPRLGVVHRPFDINHEARDAWMACMDQALDEQVHDPELKLTLHAAFFKTANFLSHP